MAQQPQIADYLARYAWPHLNGLQGIAMNMNNQSAFGYYERAYTRSPAPARRLLEFAFQKGYLDQAQRPTAYQWLQEFEAIIAQKGTVLRPRVPTPRRLHVPLRLALRPAYSWSCVQPQAVARTMTRAQSTVSAVRHNCAMTAGVRTVSASASSCRCQGWRALEGIGHRRRRGIVRSVVEQCKTKV